MSSTGAGFVAGIMSGTSMDGIDCVVIQLHANKLELVACNTAKYPPALRERLFKVCAAPELSLLELGQLDVAVGQCFAQGINELLAKQQIDPADVIAIGSHGQTIFHAPQAEYPFSMQIGDPNTIATLTGITTVADFRRRDMSAGGQGAPLAPLFHQYFFHKPGTLRCVLNIGGISNITWIGEASDDTPTGFDTGPGNVFLDMWATQWLGQPYDSNGDWAATGNVNNTLLQTLLQEPYFSMASPKSTGRELFNRHWLDNKLIGFEAVSPRDIQRTLLELTARTIADAIEVSRPSARSADKAELLVCGGGAHNAQLMQRLQSLIPGMSVASTDVHGMSADWIEASTFAWLATKTLNREKINTTPLTGARSRVILGGVYYA
jgi:anhydro-N-acetylmuramic acid kinase